MIRGLRLAVLTLLAMGTSVASAVGGSVSATLTPSKPSAASTAMVSLTGPFTSSSGATLAGLPTSLAVTVQNGFLSSAKSVTTLCTSAEASSSSGCPAASQIGTGSASVSTVLGTVPLSMKLYLGQPRQQGDIASVYVTASALGETLDATARLFVPQGGGLELLVDRWPTFPVNTVDSFSLTAHAQQSFKTTKIEKKFKGKGKKRHKVKVKVKVTTIDSLITNPSKCTGGHWTGSVSIAFSGGTFNSPMNIPCS